MSEDINPETGMPFNPLFPKPVQKDATVIPMQKFQMRFAKAEDGTRVLVLNFTIPATVPGGEETHLFFAIHGEELVKFFQYVKTGIQGNDTPSYMR